jgi:hypothetical protein
MYQLFMVGTKLLGFFLIVNGVIEAGLLTTSGPGSYGPQIAVASCVHFIMGTFLALCTGFVAKAARIPENLDGQPPVISYRAALEVGILLIAVLEILSTLPVVLLQWFDFAQMIARTREPNTLVTRETLGLLGSVLLLVFAHRIAAFLERVNRRPSDPEQPDETAPTKQP